MFIIESPSPKKQKALHHSPQTPSTVNTNPKNPFYDRNSKTPNHHNWANNKKNLKRITLGKIYRLPALHWHSWFYWNSCILANEIAWLQIHWRNGMRTIRIDPRLLWASMWQLCQSHYCHAQQYNFIFLITQRKCLNHAQEWKLNRSFSAGVCTCIIKIIFKSQQNLFLMCLHWTLTT